RASSPTACRSSSPPGCRASAGGRTAMSEHAKPMTARRATVSSASEGQTEGVGRRLAAELPPGTAIALTGPLGAGKTVFARGVASGLGVNPVDVASPTFVYLVDYSEGRIPFIHADLYRF